MLFFTKSFSQLCTVSEFDTLNTMNRCGKITNEGLKNLREGLKAKTSLKSIDLDFARYFNEIPLL